MANTTDDGNIVVERDYTDNFSIKSTAMEKLGEKYFEDIDLAGRNVGLLGFTLEHIANITEDSFNTSSILIKEAFPNKAMIPESIYSHAAIFQLSDIFASCGTCSFMLILQENEVLSNAQDENGKRRFYLDKNTIITVEGIPFTLDYDIRIDMQKKQISGSDEEYNFSAQYVIDSKNSISDINDPYLKIRKTSNGLLLLQFTAHQVERIEVSDNIIDNTKINFPVLEFEFDGKLAGFDIFYKAPSDTAYTQLTKLIMFSLPIKQPFCYYRLKDENTLKISFSSRDGYFQPEFNAEIKIVMYTTKAKDGCFDVYNGSNIEFTMCGERYDYNESLTLVAKPVSACIGGNESMSLEALQSLTVESYSNATELSTENDIKRYFYNYKYRHGNEINVIKRRDDITERLFSAFLLMKNGDYIYPTNTLQLEIDQDEFDTSEKGNRFTINPGHVFVYKEGSNDTIQIVPDIMCYDTVALEELTKENLFVYTNPFLISVTKSPNAVGFYQTITNQTAMLDFISSNDSCFTQFITSKITLLRSLAESKSYDLSLTVVPSSSMDNYVDKENLVDVQDLDSDNVDIDTQQNDVRIIAGFVGKYGTEMGYIELFPTDIASNDSTSVTYTAKLETNDYVTSDGLFSISNAVLATDDVDAMFIPIDKVTVNIYILYFDGLTLTNKLSPYFDDLKYYTITNVYSTKSDPLTFINPMNMMRSTVLFSNTGSRENPKVTANLSLLPMIKADLLNDKENFNSFIEKYTNQYTYMEECLPLLRNNAHIDIKFYNTYGKSVNYYIGDNQELIDRVNITIKFKVTIVDGVDDTDVREELSSFIKEFVEKVNISGNNDLYISNLIRGIETNFASVHHLKFMGINDYSTDNQTISVREVDLENLSKEERRKYVPEILVADRSNIILSINTN